MKERFIADVQDTSNKASASVDVVKTQIANAQASLGQVMDKMSKVAAEMQEQDKTAAIAPAKVSEIKVELGRVSEAKDIAVRSEGHEPKRCSQVYQRRLIFWSQDLRGIVFKRSVSAMSREL